MKKILLVTSVALLCMGGATAQQNPNLDFKYAVKLSNLSTLKKWSEVYRIGNNDTATIQEYEDLQLFHPTVAFQIKNKRNNIHEIELTNLSVARKVDEVFLSYNPNESFITLAGGTVTTTHIGFRYEYIKTFRKKHNSRLMPSLGFAVLPYYRRDNYKPMLSNSFPASNTTIGAQGFVIPRLCYNVSKKLFVDLNIPVCVLDAYSQMSRQKNPNLTANEQSYNTTNMELFPEFFSLRLGVGLRI